ncbi:hypothetical protein Acr_04g0003260 [Actinidia rufa]|uniref:Reverse transcriptase zinc-binding domain-containing protein n=1 Tax=Actinidia rufa TaxID=165716 RepID=A0A7J0EGI2_9ERIC|nr:hypothetical protein Acr_04g0003260 [Actinidia rufa]
MHHEKNPLFREEDNGYFHEWSSRRGRICIPVSEFRMGWKDLASVLTGLDQGDETKDKRKDSGRLNYVPQSSVNIKSREKVTYSQAASSGSWPAMSCEIQPFGGGTQDVVEVIPSSCFVIPLLRDRCLVGTLVDWTGAVPSAKELERWCNSNWGIGVLVEVKDMNGSQDMFILLSKAEMKLNMRLCGLGFLRLPVFLWLEELFRALGDRCGGYITAAEETLHREHVKWARICVRGMSTLTSTTLSIGMGSLVYVCPIWVESGARVVRWSEPIRYCDKTHWREKMGKEIAGESLQSRRGRLGFLRDLRADIKIGRRGRDWALNRLCGGVGLNYNFGPSHKKGALGLNDHGPLDGLLIDGGDGSSKGITGLDRKGVQQAQSRGLRLDPQVLGQAREAESNKIQSYDSFEAFEESSEPMSFNDLNRIKGPDALTHVLSGLESGITCGEGTMEFRQDAEGDWLSNRGERLGVKGLLNRWKCSVVCLQESKLKDVDGTIIRSLWGGRWVKWECLRANGTTGKCGGWKHMGIHWSLWILIIDVIDLGCGKNCQVPGRHGGLLGGPAPFIFENMWLQVEALGIFVRKWWEGYEVYGSPSYRLARKLRSLKEDLKSMPTYFLSLLIIPKSIALRLEKLMRDFLWKGSENATGINLGAWKIWKFALGEDKWWCRVIKGKYSTVRGAWRTKDIVQPYGICLWKGIMKTGVVKCLFGTGFWSYLPWLPIRMCLVADCWFPSLAGGFWAPLFRRGAQDWELEIFVEFFRLLQEVHPISQEVDQWRWKRQGNRSFIVSSFYHSLTGLGDPTFSWKGIWVSRVPSKVCFFPWAAANGAILITDNLRRRRIVVTEWCYMCKRNAESTDQLLLHCKSANELWSLVFFPFSGCSGSCLGQSGSTSHVGIR